MTIITRSVRGGCGGNSDSDCCNNITINCGGGGPSEGVDQSCIDMRNQLATVPLNTEIDVTTTAGQPSISGAMGPITGFTFTITDKNGDVITINICDVAYYRI